MSDGILRGVDIVERLRRLRPRRASQSASMVAYARALADRGLTSVDGFRDPFARELLPPVWRWLLDLSERGMARLPRPELEKRFDTLDMLPLRVRAIDAELERAIAAGVQQVVILGAGLDTRAYRLSFLKNATVFEVDHAATQEQKRARAAGLVPVAGRLVYVAVDFERDSLAEKLAAAGHRRDAPTVWIWEGVIMYLTDQGFRATLRSISDVSAPGSLLLVHYHERDTGEPRAMRVLLWLFGEPQIGLRTRKTMAEECRQAGLTVERDSGTQEWMLQFSAARPRRPRRFQRLMVARK